MADQDAPQPQTGRLADLRASARGWQGVQLAVLGFIGLCGVLKQDNANLPQWLQILAGLFALSALALACTGTYLIGRAAFGLYRVRDDAPAPDDDPEDVEHTSHRLTTGLVLSFVAVALTALAATSAWWPDTSDGGDAQSGLVQLQTAQASVCGALANSGAGEVRVVTAGHTIAVPIGALTAIVPVPRC